MRCVNYLEIRAEKNCLNLEYTMNKNLFKNLFAAILLLSSMCTYSGAASWAISPSQGNGDYMNEQEVDRVREAQEIELRCRVFLFIADRRLKIITGELKQQTPK